MPAAVIVSLIGISFTIAVTWAGVIIWAIRLEGRVDAAFALIRSNREINDHDHDAISDRLSDAIQALAKFDENTQEEVRGYRRGTELKIEELSRKMDDKFEKVFDKLDQKVDKD